MTLRFTTAIALLALFVAPPLMADVLLMDVIKNEPINSPEGLPRPKRGTAGSISRPRSATSASRGYWLPATRARRSGGSPATAGSFA